MIRNLTWTVAVVLAGSLSAAEFNCDFAEGKWRRDDFWEVKSPRFATQGTWVQLPDGLINTTPKPDAQGRVRYGAESYAALMWRTPVEGAVVEFSSTMSFDARMAPLLVIAPELAEVPGGREFREHWEIVLYDEGINIWHHEYRDGKPSWYLAAYMKSRFEPNQRYRLQVRVAQRHRRRMLTVLCDGRELGYFEPDLPTRFYVGLVGCEGPCRFYDFKVKTEIQKR